MDLSFLFCPFLSSFGTFPIFLGFSRFARGWSPICPFPFTRPIKSTYEEQSRKGPRHNLDLFPKKVETPRFGNRRCLLGTKNQPKEEVFGTDIPRTSGGHLRGFPGPKLRSGRSKACKNKHFGADIHDPKARTSTTLRGFQKLRSEKIWVRFSFPLFSFSRHLYFSHRPSPLLRITPPPSTL